MRILTDRIRIRCRDQRLDHSVSAGPKVWGSLHRNWITKCQTRQNVRGYVKLTTQTGFRKIFLLTIFINIQVPININTYVCKLIRTLTDLHRVGMRKKWNFPIIGTAVIGLASNNGFYTSKEFLPAVSMASKPGDYHCPILCYFQI